MLKMLNENEFESAFSILSDAFPVTEYRTKEKQKALLQKKEYTLYGIYNEEMKDELIGILGIWDLKEILFVEHFAIKQGMRGAGIGGLALQKLQKLYPSKIILEVELPEEIMQKKRIDFYEKHGFHSNSFSYAQPPLREGQDLLPLILISYPNTLSELEFLTYKKMLYDIVYDYPM